MLDQAGHHARAATYLETFLRTQGVIGPDGNFGSKEGAFQGLDIDDGTPISGHFGSTWITALSWSVWPTTTG